MPNEQAATTDRKGVTATPELDGLTHEVIGAVIEVSKQLGPGFLEKVYERALLHELRLRGIPADAQAPLPVFYKGADVGQFFADILVSGTLLVELKCVKALADEHTAQCFHYLKASGHRLCLLVNFQTPRAQYLRVVSP